MSMATSTASGIQAMPKVSTARTVAFGAIGEGRRASAVSRRGGPPSKIDSTPNVGGMAA